MVHQTQIGLSTGISLLGGASEPLHRSLVVLWNSFSFIVHQTQRELSTSISLLGGASKPLHRSLVVLWNSFPFIVHQTQCELSAGISLLGKSHPFPKRRCKVSILISINSLLEIRTPGNRSETEQDSEDHKR